MKAADSPFDEAAAAFFEYENSVRGAMRYQLTRENLQPYLAGGPKRVIDINGGSGPDTAWAAVEGHSVMLVEPSAKQLNIARTLRFPRLEKPVLSRIEILDSDISALPADKYGTFDTAFSHGAGQYLEDPESYWEDCLKAVKRGGIFSILEKGFGGTALLLAQENRITELQSFLTSKKVERNGMELPARAFTFDDIQKPMEKLGCEVLLKAGVRIVTDGMRQPRSKISDERWDTLLEEERTLGHDVQEKHIGRMLHVIVRKTN